MKLDLSKLVGGPAILKLGGAAIYTKTGINLKPSLKTFDVDVDGYGRVDKRVSGVPIDFDAIPAGVFGQIDKLYPYFNWPLGSLITPVIHFRAANVDATDDDIDLTGKFLFGLETGESVYVGSRGTIPGGLDADTVYYARVTGSTITLHDTAAHAIANTNKVAISSQGTGRHALVIERNIQIHTFDGKLITFFNGAITQPGNIKAAAEQTLFEQFSFSSYLRNRHEPTDNAARFLIEDVAFSDTSFDPDEIITQAHEVRYGGVAPWDIMDTKEGVSIEVPHTFEPVPLDGKSNVSARLTGIDVSASFMPVGIDEEEIMAQLRMQGAGAELGRSMKTDGQPLDIVGDGTFFRLYAAGLREGPAVFNEQAERAGELVFDANRAFVGGVAQPLAFFGTEDPDAS